MTREEKIIDELCRLLSDYERNQPREEAQKEKYRWAVKEATKALQEQKVGKWIYCGDEESGIPLPPGNGRYKCSLCNYSDIHTKTQVAPFCWYCGARMEGAEE